MDDRVLIVLDDSSDGVSNGKQRDCMFGRAVVRPVNVLKLRQRPYWLALLSVKRTRSNHML